MLTNGQMWGLTLAVFLPILVAIIPYRMFYKRASKIEAGMLGALGYGIIGYFWQSIIYTLVIGLVLTGLAGKADNGAFGILILTINGIIVSIFVAAAIYWGVFLTNDKQKSMYRSGTIGLGFGIGNALINYGVQLFYAIQINTGKFGGEAAVKEDILAMATSSLMLSAYRNVLMLFIFTVMALIAGKWYMEKNWKVACGTVAIIQFFIIISEGIIKMFLPAAAIIYTVFLTIVAVLAVRMMVRFLKTGEVVLW